MFSNVLMAVLTYDSIQKLRDTPFLRGKFLNNDMFWHIQLTQKSIEQNFKCLDQKY